MGLSFSCVCLFNILYINKIKFTKITISGAKFFFVIVIVGLCKDKMTQGYKNNKITNEINIVRVLKIS